MQKVFYTPQFGQIDPQRLLDAAIGRAEEAGTTAAEILQQIDYNLPVVESHVTANKAVLGPGSKITENLALLMATSPITAARITMGVDSGIVAVELNPLWEKLRDEQPSFSSRKASRTIFLAVKASERLCWC